MPKKKYYGEDKRRGVVFGRFYREGLPPLKLDLIPIDEYNFKPTKRGPVHRSEVEQQRLLHDLYLKRQKTLYVEQEEKNQKETLTAQKMFILWLEAVATWRDKRTLDHYTKAVQHLNSCLPTQLLASELKSKHIEAFAKKLSRTHSETTANSYLRDLKAGLRWCQKQRLIEYLPIITFFRITEKDPEVFTHEQLTQMLSFMEEKKAKDDRWVRRWNLLGRVWWILRYTGLRGSEVLYLRWEHILWDEADIKIKDWKNSDEHDEDEDDEDEHRVKGRKEARVGINKKLMSFLQSVSRDGEVWVLDNGKGEQYWKHLNELTAAMRKVQNSIGIYGVKPLHGFRSSIATELASKPDTNLLHVRDIMRHKDIKTTLGYVNKKNLGAKKLLDDID